MAEERVSGGDARARIERMEQNGLISAAQAERLRAGIDCSSGLRPASGRTARTHRIPLAVVITILALVFLFYLFLPGGQPEGVQDVADSLNQPGTVGVMNKFLSVSIALFILVIVPVIVIAASYNGLVNREEAVLTSWGQVESQFQRRADLIPALVETVSRYMEHERETLRDVTESRRPDVERLAEAVDNLAARQAELATVATDNDVVIEDQETLSRLFASSTAVGGNIRGLLAVVEDYPELASSDQFLELQAQLEGTENRINVARLRFNESVGAFNSAIRRIPGNIAAGLGGFRRKAYFRAEEGSDEADESLFE